MLALVDGNHVASRCMFSQVANLRRSDGFPTGITFGFLKSFFYSAKQISVLPEDSIVVWDGGRAAKRYELFPDYKKREKLLEEDFADYIDQLEHIRVGLTYLGVRQVRVSGAEADDFISVLANIADEQVVIVSGDKDFHQLVSSKISIFSGDSLSKEQDILSAWAVTSTQEILVLRAIIGDSSDKIPGIPSLGKVRAKIVVDHLGKDVPEKYQKYFDLLLKHKDILVRNLQLMTLPKSWEETFYTEEQVQEAKKQLSIKPQRSLRGWSEFCAEYEFTDF